VSADAPAAEPAFATLLRWHRRRLGLTQESLSERAGFSVEYIKKLEGGTRRPSSPSVDLLAHALELDEGETQRFRTSRLTALRTEIAARAHAISQDLDASIEQQYGPPSTEGARYGSTVSIEERRIVTVLACELTNSREPFELRDPEDVRDAENLRFEAVSAHVERYAGTVERFTGDTVLAVFGKRTAREDDSERAVICAFTMRDALSPSTNGDGAAYDTGPPFDAPATLRAGIGTGMVVWRQHSGTGPGASDLSGDVITIAERLRSAAGPGEILVAQETMRLTRNRLEYGAPHALGPSSDGWAGRPFRP
jgi:class 3 adenylate cyclase